MPVSFLLPVQSSVYICSILFIEGLMIEFGQNDYLFIIFIKRLIIELGYLKWEIHGSKKTCI